jgi:hypothetical protein
MMRNVLHRSALAFEEFVATGEQKALIFIGTLPDRGAAR